jgi:hypothetical protein
MCGFHIQGPSWEKDIRFIDNWYVSQYLAGYLYIHRTNRCHIVRKKGKGLTITDNTLNRRGVEAAHTDSMTATKWVDMRKAQMIITTHKNRMEPADKDGNK